MASDERITVDADRCGGLACIRATRVRVVDVLALLGQGGGHDEVRALYPSLEPEDVLACIEFAARLSERPLVAQD